MSEERKQRRHRPDEIGSRIYKRGRWYHVDLRWLGAGRIVLRDPSAAGWPEYGDRTDKAAVARRWRAKYEEYYESGVAHAGQGRRGLYRTIKAAAEAWISHREAQHGTSSSTVSGSRTAMKYLREVCGSDTSHQLVTTSQLQDWINTMLARGYEPATLQGYRQHVNRFFDWLGGYNPTKGLEIPTAPKKDRLAWTSESERAAIRRAAREIDAEVTDDLPSRERVVELLFATGVRIQEGAAARWDWIDPETRTIRVRGQISRAGEYKPAKGRAPRTAVVLRTWWPHHEANGVGLILAMRDGTPVPYRKLSEVVSDILKKAGLKTVGEAAHAFRHTYAFLMLESGVSMMNLQKSLGHKNVKTTQDYYDHWSPEHAARSGVEAIYGRK